MRVVILYDGGSDEWIGPGRRRGHGQRARGADCPPARGSRAGRSCRSTWATSAGSTRARKADLVFNLCEGINGHARFEDFVVGALELTGVPFTGCRHWPIAVCHRKHVANTLLAAGGRAGAALHAGAGQQDPRRLPAAGHRQAVRGRRERRDRSGRGVHHAPRRSGSGSPRCWSTSTRCWSRSTSAAGSSTSASSATGCCRSPRSVRPACPRASWPIVTYAAKWHAGSAEDLGTQPVCPAQAPADLLRRIGAVARHAWHDHGERRGIRPGGPAGGRSRARRGCSR